MTEAERYAKELIDEIGKVIGKPLKNGSYKFRLDIAKESSKIAVRRIIAANPQWIGNVVTPPRSVFFEQVLTAIDKY